MKKHKTITKRPNICWSEQRCWARLISLSKPYGQFRVSIFIYMQWSANGLPFPCSFKPLQGKSIGRSKCVILTLTMATTGLKWLIKGSATCVDPGGVWITGSRLYSKHCPKTSQQVHNQTFSSQSRSVLCACLLCHGFQQTNICWR